MAGEEENLPTDEKVRRSVARTLGNGVLFLIVLGVLGFWGSLGFYTLNPGEAAVLLRLGSHLATVTDEGLHFTLPPPLVERVVVNISELQNEDFGFRGRESDGTPRERLVEATMQTSDNNIVRVNFAVQYAIKDAFAATYRVREPTAVVRDAAEAAMREVVGRMTVDGVLRERRAALTAEARTILQDVLDSYDSGIEIRRVLLQEAQPPAPVRAAFDDVVAATQDASRLVNEAEGYRNQIVPRARAEGVELVESANGYRDSVIAEATGEAARFMSVVVEYRKAPDVTKKRLYLEAMERVLPNVEKVIVEPGTASVLPYLPLGRAAGAGVAQ